MYLPRYCGVLWAATKDTAMAAAVDGAVAAGRKAAVLVLALEVVALKVVGVVLALEAAVLAVAAAVVAGGDQADFQVEVAAPPVVEEHPVVGKKNSTTTD